jgi:hypothetical protein
MRFFDLREARRERLWALSKWGCWRNAKDVKKPRQISSLNRLPVP